MGVRLYDTSKWVISVCGQSLEQLLESVQLVAKFLLDYFIIRDDACFFRSHTDSSVGL